MTRPTDDLKGRRFLVVGMARTGLAAAQFLARAGASVTINDARPEAALADARAALGAENVTVVAGGHPEELFRSARTIVVSPGIPLALPAFEAARAAGAEIISDVELAARYLEGTILAVTGSNGKSTTTSLIGEMLRAGGLRARTCGNIGVPFLQMAADDGPDAYYALELSSFQLEAVRTLRPKVAVLTHVRPDHLDRYPSFEDYARAKARVFAAQQPSDFAVLNAADAFSASIRPGLRAQVRVFSADGPPPAPSPGRMMPGGHRDGDRLVLVAESGVREDLIDVSELPIPGTHNIENVLAAAVACRCVGVSLEALRGAIRSFHPLPHRLEKIAEIGRVAFYNDSKATNVDGAAMALGAFPGRPIWLILGGKDKGGDFSTLVPLLRTRAAGVLTIGEAAEAVERQIGGAVPVVRAGELRTAVQEGARLAAAAAGGVVLLAPACASFDQYRNFEERGEHFRRIVVEMAETADHAEKTGLPGKAKGNADA